MALREWLLTAVTGFSLVTAGHISTVEITGVATAAEAQPFNAEASSSQSADPVMPESGTAAARGMGKEAARIKWGHPEEVRTICTCVGWQEWVHRGDPKRFGGSERILLFSERILLFDEGEASIGR